MGFWADGHESFWNCDYLVCCDYDWVDYMDEMDEEEEELLVWKCLDNYKDGRLQ